MAKDTGKGSNTPADGADEAPSGTKRPAKRLRLIGSIAAVLVTSSAVGGYFALETFAAPKSETMGSHSIPSGPLPVAVATSSAVRATDYQIVSVFDGEAILATADTLIRLKVGSMAPGLGTITSVEASDAGGGSVVGTEATLRAL